MSPTALNYRIAIPTKGRAEILRRKTLMTLLAYGFPASIIDIFCVEDERQIYMNRLIGGSYANLISGAPGLANQRAFIQDYYPAGQKILMIDDDISDFKSILDYPLWEQFHVLFNLLETNNLKLFGIYPASNLYFMKDKIQKGLHYCIGSCFGIINCKDLLAPMDEKEDYYNTFQKCQTDGAILRYCGISPVTTYWKGVGGMNDYRTDESEHQGAELLMQQYPEYVQAVYRKKGGRWDLRLKKLPSVLLPNLSQEFANLYSSPTPS